MITQGTKICWSEILSSGNTHIFSLDALAAGAIRMGTVADLGASGFADQYAVYLKAEFGGSGVPTSGNLNLYLISSPDNSNWAARVTGSDGSYTFGTGNQGLGLAGDVVVSMAAPGASGVYVKAPVLWEPKGRYVVPILQNAMNGSLKDEASASNNESAVILVPLTKTC